MTTIVLQNATIQAVIPRHLFASLLVLAGVFASAQKVPVPILGQQSADLTTLTASGAPPFHLKATIAIPDLTKKTGTLEEYWVSPTKWRRIIQIPTFSQTVIVNGDDRYEKNDGEYFPVGMQTIAQALVQPIPDWLMDGLKQSKVKLDLYGGKLAKTNICDGDLEKIGAGHAQNQIYVEVCFSGEKQSISTVRYPFYDVSLEDRQAFGSYYVARHIKVGENGGTKWEATVDDLSQIKEVDESLFKLPEVTPKEKQFKLLELSEDQFREHFRKLPEVTFPDTPKPISGAITLLISIDKDGYVAEAWPSNDAYPDIAKSVREQVETWGTDKNDTSFVQIETWLTFAFKTHAASTHPAANPPTP